MFFMFRFMDASSESKKVLFTREVEEASVGAALKEYDRACSLLGLTYTVTTGYFARKSSGGDPIRSALKKIVQCDEHGR